MRGQVFFQRISKPLPPRVSFIQYSQVVVIKPLQQGQWLTTVLTPRSSVFWAELAGAALEHSPWPGLASSGPHNSCWGPRVSPGHQPGPSSQMCAGLGWADAAQRHLKVQEVWEGAGGSLRGSSPSGMALSDAKGNGMSSCKFLVLSLCCWHHLLRRSGSKGSRANPDESGSC